MHIQVVQNDNLQQWFVSRGLSEAKVEMAMRQCEAGLVVSLSDLKRVHRAGKLDMLFPAVMLSLEIEDALIQSTTCRKESVQDTTDGPREVFVGFKINSLKKLDAVEGVVEIDFQLYAHWIDPDLIGVSLEDREKEERWEPKLEINNAVALDELWNKRPPFAQDIATGKVMFGAKYRGTISNEMDLHNFPLDIDNIDINVGPEDKNNTKLVLLVDPNTHGDGKSGDSVRDNFLTEWDIADVYCNTGEGPPSGSGAVYSRAVMVVTVRRKWQFYFWKILLILLFMDFTTWTVFWQPADAFADRLSTILTVFLAAVAFLYVIATALPQLSYLTTMDQLLLLSFVFIFLTGAECFAVHLWAPTHPKMAQKIDDVSKWAFPICWAVSHVGLISMGFRQRWSKGGRKIDEIQDWKGRREAHTATKDDKASSRAKQTAGVKKSSVIPAATDVLT